MGHTLVVHDGTPHRVVPEGISLGLAVDVQRKDGSRGLVVPVIKRADTMDFAAFHAAYEGLVEKARTNRLMPDDFAGATMSLTNPGGLGTVASVPRLMDGQGSIIAVGAIGYPAEFTAVPEERLRDFGISKVMTVTSTYDHRDHPGRGVGCVPRDGGWPAPGGPRLLRADRGEPRARRGRLSARPADARGAARPGGRGPGGARDAVSRRRGHGARESLPHARPPGRAPRPARHAPDRRSGAQPRPARPHAGGDGGDSLQSAPHRGARPDAGRIAALPPGHLLRHDGLRDRAHLHPRGAGLAAREDRDRRLPASRCRRTSSGACSQRLTEVETLEKFLHKAYLGHKRFSIEGVDMLVPMLDLTIERAAESGRARRRDRHGAPRAAQRAGPHGRAGRTRRSSPSSRAAAMWRPGSSRPRAAPAT